MTQPDAIGVRSPLLIWTVAPLGMAGLALLVWVSWGGPATGLCALIVGALACTISAQQRDENAHRAALPESDEQLWALTSSLPLFLYRCRNDPDWTTLFKSDGCEIVTGYKAEDFLSGKVRFSALIHDSYRDLVWKKWQDALDDKASIELDYPIRDADGQERWVFERGHGVYDEEGTLLYIEGLVIDITDRKQAEQERDRLLAEADDTRRVLLSVLEDERRGQAERMRLILAIEQAGESFIMTDTEGIIQYVNPAFTRSSGYTRDEALGQHTRLLKSGKHSQELYQQLWQTISRGEEWTGRLVNRRKDGSLFTEDVTISAVTDPKGTITNYVAVNRDVTHELELEEQLLQAQKMELIGQMAGGIAHDFNNNLQAILGFADMAIEDHTDPDRLKEYLNEILKAGQSASALTRQLLVFSRRQVLSRQVVDMNAMLAGMVKIVERTMGENVIVEWHPHPLARFVNGDPRLLEQVVLNLVLNARDAMPDGGRLSMKLSDVELSESDLALRPDARAGRFICLAVTDTGVGIPAQIRTKIFEPFFTTKPASKGTGLGLSTVYGIVKQHEGWISVYSEDNQGTEFHVYLPLSDAAGERIAGKTAASSDDARLKGQGERILLVEDEEGIRGLMQRMLKTAGYEVVCAASAEEGQHLYEQHDGAFDMVVSDVVLPEKSGFDLVERLQEKNPRLKVLLLGGYSDERTRWSQIRQEGWRYLPKPVSRRVLLTTLREVLTSG